MSASSSAPLSEDGAQKTLPPATADGVPDDVWQLISCYLSLQGLAVLMQVSRRCLEVGKKRGKFTRGAKLALAGCHSWEGMRGRISFGYGKSDKAMRSKFSCSPDQLVDFRWPFQSLTISALDCRIWRSFCDGTAVLKDYEGDRKECHGYGTFSRCTCMCRVLDTRIADVIRGVSGGLRRLRLVCELSENILLAIAEHAETLLSLDIIMHNSTPFDKLHFHDSGAEQLAEALGTLLTRCTHLTHLRISFQACSKKSAVRRCISWLYEMNNAVRYRAFAAALCQHLPAMRNLQYLQLTMPSSSLRNHLLQTDGGPLIAEAVQALVAGPNSLKELDIFSMPGVVAAVQLQLPVQLRSLSISVTAEELRDAIHRGQLGVENLTVLLQQSGAVLPSAVKSCATLSDINTCELVLASGRSKAQGFFDRDLLSLCSENIQQHHEPVHQFWHQDRILLDFAISTMFATRLPYLRVVKFEHFAAASNDGLQWVLLILRKLLIAAPSLENVCFEKIHVTMEDSAAALQQVLEFLTELAAVLDKHTSLTISLPCILIFTEHFANSSCNCSFAYRAGLCLGSQLAYNVYHAPSDQQFASLLIGQEVAEGDPVDPNQITEAVKLLEAKALAESSIDLIRKDSRLLIHNKQARELNFLGTVASVP
jgi:hypothetical protein